MQGGFATGDLLAGGELQGHEREILSRLSSADGGEPRAVLNAHFLSSAGMVELGEMLADRRYRIEVPEEGALLVVAWLAREGYGEEALTLVAELVPWLSSLRFYPIPSPTPPVQQQGVHRQPVRETIHELRNLRPRRQRLAEREAVLVWMPLFDRLVDLFLETVQGPVPTVARGPDGSLARHADGSWPLSGGWPCQRYPEGWRTRAEALLAEYRSLRTRHRLCRRPENPGGNFAILRNALVQCAKEPEALAGREVGRVRQVLAHVVAKRGLPESARCQNLRRSQASQARSPMKAELAEVLARRFEGRPSEAGIEQPDSLLTPVSGDEAARFGIQEGARFPESLRHAALRSWNASLEDLVKAGVIPSAEVLASTVPQLSAPIAVAGLSDPDLRHLAREIFLAFQRRRSLLLLNLEHQVQMRELPWIAMLAEHGLGAGAAAQKARSLLRELVGLTLTSFPDSILPNPFLKQARHLARSAELKIPLVDEVAADIFMGVFTTKYLRAAQEAARLLGGSLYATYYSIDFDRILEMEVSSERSADPAVAAEFSDLCRRRAGFAEDQRGRFGFGFVARNGMIIEQEQILTTHNLAVLIRALNLEAELSSQGGELARRCFDGIIGTLARSSRLAAVKNAAYAWRQAVFFLSLVEPPEVEAFLAWSGDRLAAERSPGCDGLRSVVDGLASAAQGRPPDREAGASGRIFLGWSTERPHWIASPAGSHPVK
jgi:hypothetical protein